METGDCVGIGRRKCAVARVRVRPGSGKVLINREEVDFSTLSDAANTLFLKPLKTVEMDGKVDLFVRVNGGGGVGRIGAISLGLSRALQKMNPSFREALKKEGLLTCDDRVKERKKPGRPGARKRFQFSKR
jgi:small subunit ribosomal protein S9